MFMKRCTLSEEIHGTWQPITLGDLQVYYDPDLYAARISVNNDSGLVLSNTLIGINTDMQVSFDKSTAISSLLNPKCRNGFITKLVG